MKKIQLLIACLFLAGSLLSIDYNNFEEVEKMELMKVFGDEKVVDQFLLEMEVRKPVEREEPIENRTLNTEMIIITCDDYVYWFQQFADLKNEEGMATEVVSTSTIGSTQSEIRTYLFLQKYSNPSLQYVLLGGDESIIPPRQFPWTGDTVSDVALTDFYYSNVLSNWPADDDIFDIVLYPDLYVGRVPARNLSDVVQFYAKYQNYRKNYTDYTDRMAFIATNIQKVPNVTTDNLILGVMIEHLGDNISTDVLYTYDLVDTLNGCAKPVTDMLQARNYNFLYGMWHGGDEYTIFDSEYDKNISWCIREFGPHKQSITINTNRAYEGAGWYNTDPDTIEYSYVRPASGYVQLEDFVPNTQGTNYIAWLGSCRTADLDFVSSSLPVQRNIYGEIIQTHTGPNPSGIIQVDSLPSTIYNVEGTISQVFFNELGGPVALYASTCVDFPYFTYRIVNEYMDLMFIDGYHKLGYLTRESWNVVSYYFTNRVIRELYLGHNLFGDPSMDVWSAEAEKLITILQHGGFSIGYTFRALNSSGVETDAEICIVNSDGDIMGKGDSPFLYEGKISDNWIITSNKPNYIQARDSFVDIKDYSSLPYVMDFEDGVDYNWEMHSSNSHGRILVTENHFPHSGNKHLTMDCDTTNCWVTNEAWLHLNLENENSVYLEFWWKEFSDETHLTDGVYFSDNAGTSFIKVHSLAGSNRWQEITLNVDSLCTYYSLVYSDNFIIKFQQYDDNPITSDGFAFDDISVFSSREGEENISGDNEIVSTEFLLQSYPNPFNPSTTFSFSIPNDSRVELTIYNVKGQEIRTLISDDLNKGEWKITWDGKDTSGNLVGTGIYFSKLSINGKNRAMKKVLLLK
ncbi:MAG: T9SS type A sorting domain-containing protein [Armatimonadetes bacterium]|nr:T9SS type A sorting domain-containing protein [Armatimonadota bacterium]